MNKKDLISSVAEKSNLTKLDAAKAVDAVLKSISDAMQQEEKVTLVGFGTFGVSMRAERIGRNPKTKEQIKIAAKKVVKFKPGSELTF